MIRNVSGLAYDGDQDEQRFVHDLAVKCEQLGFLLLNVLVGFCAYCSGRFGNDEQTAGQT